MAKTEEAKENAKKKTTTFTKKTAAPKRKVDEEKREVKEEVVAKKESKKSNKFGWIIGLLLVVALVVLFVVSLNESDERSKYLKEMLVNIYLLDLYIGISLEKNIIKKKRFNSFVNSLNEIKKMINSWSMNEKKK